MDKRTVLALNAKGYCPLMYAAQSGEVLSCIFYLNTPGTDKSAYQNKGITAKASGAQ